MENLAPVPERSPRTWALGCGCAAALLLAASCVALPVVVFGGASILWAEAAMDVNEAISDYD